MRASMLNHENREGFTKLNQIHRNSTNLQKWYKVSIIIEVNDTKLVAKKPINAHLPAGEVLYRLRRQ